MGTGTVGASVSAGTVTVDAGTSPLPCVDVWDVKGGGVEHSRAIVNVYCAGGERGCGL